MPDYTVGEGESIRSIAKDQGFFWKTIWDHGKNAQLKNERKDPNVLFEGDNVFIPDLEKKYVDKPTEQTHEFIRKGEPAKFKLRLQTMDQPRKNEPYTLIIDGKVIHGSTDGNGKLECPIPGNAKGGKLILKGGKEEYAVKIGNLDPVDKPSGVRQRLNNLGFNCGASSTDEKLDPETADAIRQFQEKYKLQITGKITDEFKSKLKQLHP